MNEGPKKVVFSRESGQETVSLEVGCYIYGKRLFIRMISHDEDGTEPFADMTVNIPEYPLAMNEAFINGDISEELLTFICTNGLGKKLPYTVQSGYRRYAAVAFDLDRLKEFDPEGVAKFMKLRGEQDE